MTISVIKKDLNSFFYPCGADSLTARAGDLRLATACGIARYLKKFLAPIRKKAESEKFRIISRKIESKEEREVII